MCDSAVTIAYTKLVVSDGSSNTERIDSPSYSPSFLRLTYVYAKGSGNNTLSSHSPGHPMESKKTYLHYLGILIPSQENRFCRRVI